MAIEKLRVIGQATSDALMIRRRERRQPQRQAQSNEHSNAGSRLLVWRLPACWADRTISAAASKHLPSNLRRKERWQFSLPHWAQRRHDRHRRIYAGDVAIGDDMFARYRLPPRLGVICRAGITVNRGTFESRRRQLIISAHLKASTIAAICLSGVSGYRRIIGTIAGVVWRPFRSETK